MAKKELSGKPVAIACSFCGNAGAEFVFMGPSVAICSPCVGFCTEIIDEERAAAAERRRQLGVFASVLFYVCKAIGPPRRGQRRHQWRPQQRRLESIDRRNGRHLAELGRWWEWFDGAQASIANTNPAQEKK